MNKSDHIFISYCNIEADFALKLAVDLKNRGVRIWMAKLDGIVVGMDWREAIQNAINDSAAMVAILSPNYVDSEYCKKELARANTLKLPIFPVLLRSVEAKRWPLAIEGIQYEDFTEWPDEKSYIDKLEKFLHRLKNEISRQVSKAPDAEKRYLNSLLAEMESKRGVLEYVELYAEITASPIQRPNPHPDDEWAYSLLLKNRSEHITPDFSKKILLKNITKAIEHLPRLVLLGEPGAGKTTVIRRLASDAARKRLQNPDTAPIPLILYLQDWQNNQTIADFIRAGWPLASDPMHLLQSGKILLFLDGLNEIIAHHVNEAEQLQHWFESEKAPKYAIITCRINDYRDKLKIDGLETVKIQPLNEDLIKQFAENYLNDKAPAFLKRLKHKSNLQRKDSSPLFSLAHNPYMLCALIYLEQYASTSNLPRNTSELFQRLTKALWERERLRDTLGWIQYHKMEQIYSELAFSMLEYEKAINVSVEFAAKKIGNMKLLLAGVNANFLTMRERQVSFYHQLLQEYFAAKYIGDNIDKGSLEHLVNNHMIDLRWREVFLLTSEILNDPVDFFLLMNNNLKNFEKVDKLDFIQKSIKRDSNYPAGFNIILAIIYGTLNAILHEFEVAGDDYQKIKRVNDVVWLEYPDLFPIVKLASSTKIVGELSKACDIADHFDFHMASDHAGVNNYARDLGVELIDQLQKEFELYFDNAFYRESINNLEIFKSQIPTDYLLASALLLECLNTENNASEAIKKRILNEIFVNS